MLDIAIRRLGLGLGLALRRKAIQTLAVDRAVIDIAGAVRQGLTRLRFDQPAVRLVRPKPVVARPEEVAPARRVSEQLVIIGRVEIAHAALIIAREYRNLIASIGPVAQWSFLTNHARALLCIAHDPGLRLRDMAEALGITERSAFGIVADLTEAGYVLKERDGRRNRYSIQRHMPLPDATSRERTVGEVLNLLVGTKARPPKLARSRT